MAIWALDRVDCALSVRTITRPKDCSSTPAEGSEVPRHGVARVVDIRTPPQNFEKLFALDSPLFPEYVTQILHFNI